MIQRVACSMLVAALGCQRLVDDPGAEAGDTSSDDDPISACDGALTQTPTALFETGAYAPDVILDGDTLVLVEPGQHGWLRRLDRCTGAELGSIAVPFLHRAILHEGAVVFTGISEGPNPYLERWDEAAEGFTNLSEGRFGRLYSLTGELYLAADEEIFRFDEPDSLTLIHTIETQDIPGLYVSHIGASATDFYYRVEYDCGCTPALVRWPIGSQDGFGMAGSAGARRLVAVGDRIFINAEQNPDGFGSGIDDIVELPSEGGEPTVLHAGALEDRAVQDIAVSDEWVCWTNQVVAPRCVNRSDPNERLEFSGEFAGEGTFGQLALGEDALYWFAEDQGESVLMVAAL